MTFEINVCQLATVGVALIMELFNCPLLVCVAYRRALFLDLVFRRTHWTHLMFHPVFLDNYISQIIRQ